MPSAEEALPGRDGRCRSSRRHLVLGTPLAPPFPEGTEQAIFGMGCFWGAERLFWRAPGVYTTAVGYAGGFTPNPTYQEVCTGRTGHTEVVLAVFDPAQTSYEEMLRIFWEGHDPTQGMRQGNDVGTQYRSAIYWTTNAQRDAALASRDMFQAELSRGRLRADHDRDRRGRPVLLRRGLPPAVPRREPERLLRPRRHGRLVPDRALDDRLKSCSSRCSSQAPVVHPGLLGGWGCQKPTVSKGRTRMKLHANHRRCPSSRRLICRRVLEQGWTIAQAAEASGCSERTASKWIRRYREGDHELIDRSSRPGRSPNRPRPSESA